jgi:hypothetical protein
LGILQACDAAAVGGSGMPGRLRHGASRQWRAAPVEDRGGEDGPRRRRRRARQGVPFGSWTEGAPPPCPPTMASQLIITAVVQ